MAITAARKRLSASLCIAAAVLPLSLAEGVHAWRNLVAVEAVEGRHHGLLRERQWQHYAAAAASGRCSEAASRWPSLIRQYPAEARLWVQRQRQAWRCGLAHEQWQIAAAMTYRLAPHNVEIAALQTHLALQAWPAASGSTRSLWQAQMQAYYAAHPLHFKAQVKGDSERLVACLALQPREGIPACLRG